MLRNLFLVMRIGTNGKNAAMNLGMKRLHSPVQHFGETRHLRDVADLQAALTQEFGRAARG